MTERTKPICPNCGGDSLVSDAAARWNFETQAWELSCANDDKSCDDCGNETGSPEWIDADRRDPAFHVFKTNGAGYLAAGWWVRCAEGVFGPELERDNADAARWRIEEKRKRLFNCCTNSLAPDWSQFSFFVIGGCKDDPDDPGYTLGLCSDEEAEFWTIYAYREPGDGEAITDCKTKPEAEAAAAELSQFSDLPIGWPSAVEA
ncbi:hypothetical protein SAMN06265338_1363 [Rhodoblastus acidophilus]|uniref:Uncharacterized protein n=1 Tax=Rhodoblastus acidophilus TaxID=1074 RepID=A0A212SFD9_RHOAC|nr:hypothetical protein [Rhodoblastus acidophilus]PPQ37287.1 hypothetical protein CKO16_15180 [Rhodoblastus acidophilus]RAI16256.1 hypothetical protein CH337_22330 [Rhodoblastus acidophilus]SNB84434.1 hypothetical protein SAMN06265338_1363 [Rhodoblastus acidophilus]